MACVHAICVLDSKHSEMFVIKGKLISREMKLKYSVCVRACTFLCVYACMCVCFGVKKRSNFHVFKTDFEFFLYCFVIDQTSFYFTLFCISSRLKSTLPAEKRILNISKSPPPLWRRERGRTSEGNIIEYRKNETHLTSKRGSGERKEKWRNERKCEMKETKGTR